MIDNYARNDDKYEVLIAGAQVPFYIDLDQYCQLC